jgi:hemerythrin-like domain-containing protein
VSEAETSDAPPIPISEHNRVLTAVHKAMRADSGRLIGAVGALPDGDTHRAAALGRAFAAVVSLIHDHHWTEDDVMYPFLLERVDTFEGDAIRLENDHVALDAAMARINARFRLLAHQVSPSLWRDTRSHLAEEAAAFDQLLVDHLDREEAVVVPAVESMLSAADRHVLQKEESKLVTYRHMRMAVPWVLANATPEEEAELRATAPGLLGVVQDRVWEPRFVRLMAPLYRSAQA